jgi:hypothetical protein
MAIIGSLFTIGLIYFEPRILWGSGWKTQDILYRNKKNENERIEYQMEDMGAFGYNQRIVRVKKGWLFDSVYPLDTNLINKSDWIQVNEYVNELRIKGG